MNNSELSIFQGTWELVSSHAINSEIEILHEDDEASDDAISDWLNDDGRSLLPLVQPAQGLRMEIHADGFSEQCTGDAQVMWFDAEGCLSDTVQPFSGRCTLVGSTAYLRPETMASWAMPQDNQYGNALLRYDDGDTQICDRLTQDGDRLLRSVNVVTDGLYLNRVIMVYARS